MTAFWWLLVICFVALFLLAAGYVVAEWWDD